MKVPIVKIGNSRGIRLPKPVIEQCGFKDEVDLEVEEGCVIIKMPAHKARSGWNEAFSAMRALNDDNLKDDQFNTEWDSKEWQW